MLCCLRPRPTLQTVDQISRQLRRVSVGSVYSALIRRFTSMYIRGKEQHLNLRFLSLLCDISWRQEVIKQHLRGSEIQKSSL